MVEMGIRTCTMVWCALSIAACGGRTTGDRTTSTGGSISGGPGAGGSGAGASSRTGGSPSGVGGANPANCAGKIDDLFTMLQRARQCDPNLDAGNSCTYVLTTHCGCNFGADDPRSSPAQAFAVQNYEATLAEVKALTTAECGPNWPDCP